MLNKFVAKIRTLTLVIKIIIGFILFKLRRLIRHTKLATHIGKHKYEVQYYINDKMYRFRTQIRRGPKRVRKILDRQQNDITCDLMSYIGPNEDCHNQSLTPSDIGYDGIYVFITNHGGCYLSANSVININNIFSRVFSK